MGPGTPTVVAAGSLNTSTAQDTSLIVTKGEQQPIDLGTLQGTEPELSDGGFAAWIQVLGGFFVWMNTL
jgi:hypothetical protein